MPTDGRENAAPPDAADLPTAIRLDERPDDWNEGRLNDCIGGRTEVGNEGREYAWSGGRTEAGNEGREYVWSGGRIVGPNTDGWLMREPRIGPRLGA